MVRRMAMLLALLLFMGLSAQAAPDETIALAQPVLSEQVKMLQLDADAPPAFVRAAYAIDVAGQALPEALAPYYGDYARVIVLEYGYYVVHPIVSSKLLAVGIEPDGGMEPCKTPDEIVARIFDYEPLRQLNIEPLSVE